MFTHPGHLPPPRVLQAFAALLPKSANPAFKILHEIGKSDYEHTHTIMLLDKRIKCESVNKWKKFRESLGQFDLKPISSDEHFQNALGYDKSSAKKKTVETSKVVLDQIGDWKPVVPFHIQCIQFLQNVKSWKDVLVNREFSEYISGKMNWAREVYMHARCRSNFEFPSGRAYDWQQTFIDFLKTPPDNRTVNWVCDRIGGNGKSDLTNYLLSHENAFLVDCGKLADIAYAYDNQPIVVFDLARDTEDYCPYRAMEAFKNGRFFSPKYNSCLKTFTPPHVIVFANYKPDESKLSRDRWDIIELDEQKLSHAPTSITDRKTAKGCPPSIKAPPGKKGISIPAPVISFTDPTPIQEITPNAAQWKKAVQKEVLRQMASAKIGSGDCSKDRTASC